MNDRNRRPRRRWHLALLLIPFGWQVALVPLVNDVKLAWFGVPFPMVWQMLGIVVATIALGIVFRIDRKRDAAEARLNDNELPRP